MKTTFLSLLFVAALASCAKIEGEGEIITNDYKVTPTISNISVGSAINLELSDDVAVGEVKIETYENIFEHIDFNMSKGSISVTLDKGRYAEYIPITVYASAAQYDSVVGSGASSISLLDPISFTSYDIKLSGASEFEMQSSFDNIEDLDIVLSGASDMELKGSAVNCDIKASGASSVEAAELKCNDLYVVFSGASELKIDISGSAKGSLSGASKLYYSGEGEIDIDTSGASVIKPL